MSDLISRKDAIEALSGIVTWTADGVMVKSLCQAAIASKTILPSAEPERKKVPHQYSVGDHGKSYVYGSCPHCGAPVIKPDKYCSECGQGLEWE